MQEEITMSEIIIKQNGLTLGIVENEEDLKPKSGININPPLEDGRCDCCGRHISELKPYGEAGDPLVGDFSGALLVMKFRPEGPYDEEAVKAFQEAERWYWRSDFDNPLGWLIDKYGKEKTMKMYDAICLNGTVGKSWECRDCVVLNVNEYHKKQNQSWPNPMKT